MDEKDKNPKGGLHWLSRESIKKQGDEVVIESVKVARKIDTGRIRTYAGGAQ